MSRASGRKRAKLSPSLFPFLAVLVCTLGTLILLLALVAQDAKQSAVAEAQENALPQPPKPDAVVSNGMNQARIEQAIQEAQFRLTEVVAHRDSQTADLEESREKWTHLQDHSRRLMEELRRLKDEIQNASSTEMTGEIDRQTLTLMKSEIDQLETEIGDLRESQVGEKPRVVLVPHKGPNGTDRRPVYVECVRDGVVIHPENVRITARQLAAAAESRSAMGNPLDAALRTIRMRALRVYGDAIPPYPLMVVRPDGIESFYMATTIMRDWDDQYGYELVPGDVDLEFPDPDSALRKELQVVIHEANARNMASAARIIRSNGSSSHGSGRGNEIGADDGNRMNGSGGPFRSQRGGESLVGSEQSNPYATAAGDNSGRIRRSRPTLSAKSLDQQARSHGFHGRGDFSAEAFDGYSGAAGGYGNATPGFRSASFGASPSDAFADASSFNDAEFTGSDSSRDAFGQAGKMASGSESFDAMEGNERASNEGGGASQSNPKGGAIAAGASKVEGSQESLGIPLSEMGGTSAAASVSQSSSSATQQLGSPSLNSQQASNTPPPLDSNQVESSQMSSTKMDSNAMPKSPPITDRLGTDWAMPRHMAGVRGTDMVRPITVVCYPDQFAMLQRGEITARFPITQNGVNEATLKLATAIRDRVATWGATIPGGRWQPQLEVIVAPHGDRRFHELRTLMQGSGVDVIKRVR